MDIIANYINGQQTWIQKTNTSSKAFSTVFNPATGDVIRQVGLSSSQDVNMAIQSAQNAFYRWSKLSPLKRARVLFNFKTLLEIHRDRLAAIISQEHGKVYSDAQGELTRGIEVVEFACGIPHLQKGEHSSNVGTGVDSFSLMQPLGVCVGITPFNFPAMVPMWMFPIAIATGNTFILKPSEKDPSLSLELAKLLTEAGLPNGVFNVVQGNKAVVDQLLTAPEVQAVSFVGSTPIAEYVYRTASEHGKRCQALGGAKNHCIVMPDADFDSAANAILGAAYGSAGERCMALSVVVAVGDKSANEIIERLKSKIQTMKIGAGIVAADEPENDMGPVISAEHKEKIIRYIDSGVNEGARLVVDGRNLVVKGNERGFFVGPTLFDEVTPNMTIYQQEIFGPVLCVLRVEDFQTALSLVNQHEYGNGTALFTRDGETVREFTENVQAGMVGINIPIPVPMAFHSFGGWKRSIFGPLNVHGNDGVRFYTRMKTVTSSWPSSIRLEKQNSDFIMPTM